MKTLGVVKVLQGEGEDDGRWRVSLMVVNRNLKSLPSGSCLSVWRQHTPQESTGM